MLDKYAKTVLDTLISNGYTYPQDNFQSLEASLIPLLQKHNKYDWSFDMLAPCIDYLIKHEYVDGVSFQRGYYPVLDYRQLHATYKGQHYKDFQQIELRTSLLNSVVLPVAASLITSLIVTACGYMWSMSSSQTRNANIEPTAAPITDEISCTNNE